jgi:hypothetical protein
MNPLQQLTKAIAHATALGGEVILTGKAALAIMNAAGLRLWEDLAAAANADISYDSSISCFRFTALEDTWELATPAAPASPSHPVTASPSAAVGPQ